LSTIAATRAKGSTSSAVGHQAALLDKVLAKVNRRQTMLCRQFDDPFLFTLDCDNRCRVTASPALPALTASLKALS
jgi:hypothetical protein